MKKVMFKGKEVNKIFKEVAKKLYNIKKIKITDTSQDNMRLCGDEIYCYFRDDTIYIYILNMISS